MFMLLFVYFVCLLYTLSYHKSIFPSNITCAHLNSTSSPVHPTQDIRNPLNPKPSTFFSIPSHIKHHHLIITAIFFLKLCGILLHTIFHRKKSTTSDVSWHLYKVLKWNTSPSEHGVFDYYSLCVTA